VGSGNEIANGSGSGSGSESRIVGERSGRWETGSDGIVCWREAESRIWSESESGGRRRRR